MIDSSVALAFFRKRYSTWPAYDRLKVEIDALAAELLARPLKEFTAYRNARAKELKASGQTDLAGWVSALKKPSLPLWATNRLAGRERALLDELRRSAQAVVEVQAAAAAGRPNAARDLHEASAEFQRKLEAAGKAASTALGEAEHPAGEEVLRRMQEILRLAALHGGEMWQRLERGAMISEPQAGEDMLAVFGAGSSPAVGKQAERAEARRAVEEAQRAARTAEERAQRAAATAQRLRHDASEMAAAAERAAERAKAAEDEAARAQAQAEESRRATRQQSPV